MPARGDSTWECEDQNQLSDWEIEGLNDEEIVAELLDERVELAIATAPPYDCGCDSDCDIHH